MSALVTRSDIARTKPWSNPSFSSSSYGGNPLAAAAIAASVGIIRSDGLAGNARKVGAFLKQGLLELSERHPELTAVRGEGLMIGFDLVVPGTRTLWDSPRCHALFQALLRRGILSMAYAPRVRVNPPLIITLHQAAEALSALEGALQEVARA